MKLRAGTLKIDPQAPFSGDALGRKPLVDFLEGIISKIEGPMVLALDSPWGTGKTTLVEMLRAQLAAKQFRCIYFNAWAVDYSSDPLVALLSKLDLVKKGASPETQQRLKRLKSIATLVGKRGLIAAVKASTLGVIDLDEEIEAALADGAADGASDLFDLAIKEGECLAKFREDLAALVEETRKDDGAANLVFFVDELDRCRPTFAIELLERIKHLFDVPNIVFVLSIDKTQLEVSTSSVYGNGINAREYLRRFIDLEFQVPQVFGKPFIDHLLQRFGLDKVFMQRVGELRSDMSTFVDVLSMLASTTSMSLRTQEHCIARLALVLEQTPSNYYLYPVLAATLIVTRAMHPQLFSQIKTGAASTEELMDWLRGLARGNELRSRAAVAIEAYMNAADPDHARQARRQQSMKTTIEAGGPETEDRKHARDVWQFTQHLAGSFNGPPNLDYLLAKIDLAANIQR